MNKYARTRQMTSSISRSYLLRQSPRKGNLRWWLVVACCCIAFVCTFGIANAAQNQDPSSTLSKKMQSVDQQFVDGRAHARPKPTSQEPAAIVAQPAPDRQAGIFNTGQGPFPHTVFAVTNSWQGPVNDDWVLAYVGTKMQPDGSVGTGGIVLYTETVNKLGGFDLHPLGTFLAPTGTTALTVISQQDNLLTLQSKTGQELSFDLLSHQFH